MTLIEYQLIESGIILMLFFIIRFIVNWSVKKTWKVRGYVRERLIVVRRATSFILIIVFGLILSSIWGIDQSEIILFVTSILTVIGIAFFAQWSILSNITAGLILFFNNDIRYGEYLTVLEKDNNINGIVIEIGVLFTRLKTDEGKVISIPNSIIIQKMISVENKE